MFGQWISKVFEDRDFIYEGAKCDPQVRLRNVMAAGFKAFTEQALEVDFHSSASSVIITLVGQQVPSSPLILVRQNRRVSEATVSGFRQCGWVSGSISRPALAACLNVCR